MKDPTRLLESSTSELELQLLRAGASDQPPAAAIERLTHKLGVGTNGTTAVVASKLGLLPIGVVALGIGLGSIMWTSRATPPPAAVVPPPPVAAAAEPNVMPAAQTPEAEPTSSLALEIARIDAIRSMLSADHAKSAIAAVQDFRRDFPHGMLRQEADVLNIEAHRRAGDRRSARTLATRFLAEHPQSPHNARVRDLLDAL